MKKYLEIILTVIFAAGIFFINRDLFYFEYHDIRERLFSPDNDQKGFYYLGEGITLKPGSYTLTIQGDLPEYQSEIVITGNQDEIIFKEEFNVHDHNSVFDFEINGKPQYIRILFNYEPQRGPVRIEHITLTCDNVLTKESLLTHGFMSILILLVCCILFLRFAKTDLFFSFFPFFSNSDNEKDLVFLILLTVLVSVPLLIPNKHLDGFDLKFHLNRLNGIATNLQAGLFPPRVELHWMDDVGYGVGLFYPEIFLVIPAIFLMIDFPLLSVYKAFGLIIVFLTLISHYWAAKKLSKGNRTAGLSAAIFISLAVYRIQAHFIRNGIGETIAVIFLPLIVTGLYQVLNQDPKGWKIFALGFSGTLLSHVLSFVLAFIFTGLFLFTQIHRIFRDRKIIIDLCKAVIFTIFLTAFFFFPMVEQKFAVPDLKINQITDGKIDMSYATGVQSAADLLRFSQQPGENPVIFYPGWSLLFIPFFGLILYFQKKSELEVAHILTLYAVIIMILSTNIFPWHMIQFFLNDIQFSFRLLQSATTLLCLGGSLYIAVYCQNRPKKIILLGQVLLCVISAIPVYNMLYHDYLKSSEGFIVQNDTTYGSEYMPPQLSRPYIKTKIDKIEDTAETANFFNFHRNGLSVTFDYITEASEKDINFIVPFIYYKGYKAEIQNSEDKTIEAITEAAENGFVHIQSEMTPTGHVHVWYNGTMIQTISDVISLLTLFGLIIMTMRKKKDKTAGLYEKG